jgi:hypothetical protein
VAIEDRIQELYSLPLEDFTSGRNELADELKAEDDKDGAAQVRALKKPSVAAWAVNQVARRYADDVSELASLRESLRSPGSAKNMRAASNRRHQLISDLVEKAQGILEEAGNAASSQTLAKVSSTLYGATDEQWDALESGTITRELEASGFDDAAELDWGVAEPENAAKAGGTSKKAEKERLAREELEAELEEARKAAKTLALKAERARSAADAAEVEATTARERVERLRARLERG